ncbi:MAG: DMT family transporter, partial [Pelagibacteraceae bacterium]
ILAPFTLREVVSNILIIKDNLFSLIIMGFTSISIFNSVVYYSLNFTQVLNGVLMISTIPVLIIFFSSLLKTENIKLTQVLGVLISLAGVVTIITKAELSRLLHLQLNKGDLWMIVAMVSWATYSIMLKEKKINLDPLVFLEITIFFGLIFLIPMYYYEVNQGKHLVLNIPVLLTVAYVVLFAGLGAYFFWIGAIKLIGPSRSGVFLHLMPVFSSLMAVFLLGEIFSSYHVLGALFIIIGIFISSKK